MFPLYSDRPDTLQRYLDGEVFVELAVAVEEFVDERDLVPLVHAIRAESR